MNERNEPANGCGLHRNQFAEVPAVPPYRLQDMMPGMISCSFVGFGGTSDPILFAFVRVIRGQTSEFIPLRQKLRRNAEGNFVRLVGAEG